MNLEFKTAQINPMFSKVIDVAAQEVLEKKDQVVLIDVREPFEYTGDLGHVAGTTLISVGELPARLNEIPKDKVVVFICRSGNRSAHAAAYVLDQGYSTVYNMAGGMLMWNQLMLPTERS